MQVIIVGCGKVGDSLAYYLAKEKCDITVIDINAKLIEKFTQNYDINGVCGNATTYDTLIDAGVNNTDILIAATNSDEVNTLCCIMAKSMGVSYVIARVRNPEYAKQNKFMKEQLGIDMMINPDAASAGIITRMLAYPAALNIEVFNKGLVTLVEVEIKSNSLLINKKVSEIPDLLNFHVLICTVIRDGEVFIPSGDFVLYEKDRIYVTSHLSNLTNFFKLTYLQKNKIKDVMIIGGGRIAHYIAKNLEKANINLRIIEINKERADYLSSFFPHCTIINGDGTNPELLDEENIKDMDAFVSLTGMDEENILTSLYANNFNIEKIITKVNRHGFVKIAENSGCGTVITPKEIIVSRIVQYVRAKINSTGSNVRKLYRLVNNRIEALEFKVAHDAKCINVPLKDLIIKPNILIGAIIRDEQVIFPKGTDCIFPDDEIIIISMAKYIYELDDILSEEWKPI